MIKIDNIEISKDSKPYIIAELSGNHNGSIDRALNLMELAAEAGADAIKLQTYTADTLTIDCDEDDFLINDGLWKGKKLYDLYNEAHTPWEWHKELFDKGKELGITVFSTPFDESAVDFLEDLEMPAYKVASFEILDLPLIEYIASKKKPIIMSTGMANLPEIRDAVEVIEKYHKEIIILHCVSGYPTPYDQANLKTIMSLQTEFPEYLIGLSDHTLGTSVPVTSIALGARVIEKHFTDDRTKKGPDSDFSLEPHELKALVDETKQAWDALGVAGYKTKKVEESSIKFRRSLYFVKDIKKGEEVTKENLRRIRPGYGISPKYYNDILGKKVSVDVKRGTPVSLDHIN